MNEKMSIVVSEEVGDEKYIQVPIKKKDFGSFITNLLGQPETITGDKVGSFCVTQDWLRHLHHMIDQRINQQNHAELVDFSALFIYASGADRKITSIDAFLHFNEAKITTTKGLKITWTYLATFPARTTPEKQEISIDFFIERPQVIRVSGANLIHEENGKKGVARYRISHTERTWGDDIQSLISRELDDVFLTKKWYDRGVEGFVVFSAMALFISGFVIPDYIGKLIRDHELNAIIKSFTGDGMNLGGLAPQQKVDLIINLLKPGVQDPKIDFWFRIASAFAGIFMGVFTITTFDKPHPSFLVITGEDRKREKEKNISQTKELIKRVSAFSGAIVSGMLATYLYYILKLPQ